MQTAREFIHVKSKLKDVIGGKSLLSCEVILAVDFFLGVSGKVVLQ